MNRQEFWLRLLSVKGCRTKSLKKLHVKDEITDYQVEQLLRLAELTPEQKRTFFQIDEKKLHTNLMWLERTGHYLVTYNEVNYPTLLKHVKDAPLALFVQGKIENLNLPQLAMVGSRNFSPYGKRWGEYFAAELAANGFVVTSGLALGIDSICHRAVVERKGITIAVLGSGLSMITPKRHFSLAQNILEQNGVLVSEFFPTAPAMPEHFPRRNRIVSGLSRGVLVIEATLKSGSLITARCALEQGREVFALPGPLGHDGYQGTHWLIQQGANLVTQPIEIVNYMNSSLNWLSNDEVMVESVTDDIPIFEQRVLPFSELLSNVGDDVTPIDLIAESMSLPITEIALQLLELELNGDIASVQGGYVRIRKL